ncbi:hypothetical protein EOM39_07335, partial [Candidatus Gracilibacteria bacterium]|nr:hypothetical protein [Candidatus Gracilibacteria bacterium]
KIFGNQFYYQRISDVEACIRIFFQYLNKSLPEDFELKSIEYLEGKFKVDNREYNIGKILNELKNNVNKIQNSDNIKKIKEEKGRVEANHINYHLSMIDKRLKIFNSRPAIKNIECQIVISRDPYDIAGMSTDRKWHSCMELKNENENYDERLRNTNEGGSYRYYVKNDLTEGSLIAYLIDKNDREIEAPYARVLIKPYINRQGDQIFLSPEARVYKDDMLIDSVLADKFLAIVDDWAKEQQKDLKGKFYANPNLYYDGKASVFAGKSLSIEEAVYKSIKWDTLFKQDKIIIKNAIKTNYINRVDDLIKKYNDIIHKVLFENKIYMPFIDASKIKNENYTNLDFPVRILSDEEKDRIYYYKLNYNLFPTHEFISFDEIARQLKKEEKIKNKTVILNFIEDLENISTDDRFDTESYDIILTRDKIKTNSNNLIQIDEHKYIYDYLFLDKIDYDKFYLYTAYLVSSDITDLNKALMKIYLNLYINGDHIDSKFSYDIISKYNKRIYLQTDGLLSAYVTEVYINPEFDIYLDKKDKNSKFMYRFQSRLFSAIDRPVDTLELDVYLLTSLHNFDSGNSISADDDRYIPADEYEISDKQDQVRTEFKNLEKEVFGDSDLNLLSYDKD